MSRTAVALRIIFAGSATMDMIFRVDTLPVGGGKTLPSALAEAAHSMATSAAASVARRGEATLAARFNAFVAVTAGADGCHWMDSGKSRHLAAPTVKTVNTLAAGDVFHGAFTLALAERRSEANAITFANAAAALKCTAFGGRLGMRRRRCIAGGRTGDWPWITTKC